MANKGEGLPLLLLDQHSVPRALKTLDSSLLGTSISFFALYRLT